MRRRAAALTTTGMLVVSLLTGCAALLPAPRAAEPVVCDPDAPAGASAEAQAYTEAAHRAHAARKALSDKITAQGNTMSLDDMRTSAVNDEAFLAELGELTFPPEAADAARAFVHAVELDSGFLLAAAAEDGYYSAHLDERERLYEDRTRSGLALREALDLPPSGCSLSLP